MRYSLVAIVFAFSALACSLPKVSGDEGMYLFNDLPLELLKERHEFEPSEKWADDLRLSSVRFNSGGSGSFISSEVWS